MSSIESSDRVCFSVRLKPSLQQQAITPRALAEPPVAAVRATAEELLRRCRRLLSPPYQPHRSSSAATAPADALTVAPPVPSAAATGPAKAHEETRGASNTSARRRSPICYHPLLSPTLRARQYTNMVADHCYHPHNITPPSLSSSLDLGSPMLAFITGRRSLPPPLLYATLGDVFLLKKYVTGDDSILR